MTTRPEKDSSLIPDPLADPIRSRFLFVDVAAQRASQLHKGARIRLHPENGNRLPVKLERVAMDEVKHGLVQYRLPSPDQSYAA